jgi:hypothetical protein
MKQLLQIAIPQLTLFRTHVFCPKTRYIKSSMQIRTYDAENIFKLLSLHDHELTLDDHVEIQKQSAL